MVTADKVINNYEEFLEVLSNSTEDFLGKDKEYIAKEIIALLNFELQNNVALSIDGGVTRITSTSIKDLDAGFGTLVYAWESLKFKYIWN